MKTAPRLALLFLAIGLIVASAQTYTFTTYLGAPDGSGYGSADGTGSSVVLAFPNGVAVDGSGNPFVADTHNHTIRKITPDGFVLTLAGSRGSAGSEDGTGSTARFYYPRGVAVDGSGNVFVADSSNYTVRKITSDGVVTTLAGKARTYGHRDSTGTEAWFHEPYDVAVDASGNVFVADNGSHTIRKITAGGVVTTLAGTPAVRGGNDGTGTAARFWYPRAVALDRNGNLFVADSENHTIRKVTAGGVVTTLAGSAERNGAGDGTGSAARFWFPSGVEVDGNNNVFVGDNGNRTIRKISASGVVTTFAGTAGTLGSTDGTGSAARFNFPAAVAVDGSGNVLVADRDNHTIRKNTPCGVVTTVAGTAGVWRINDGAGSDARFDNPAGLALDGNGNMFVADLGRFGTGTLRKITAGGMVTSLAGGQNIIPRQDDTGFLSPQGLAVDFNGNVFLSDTGHHTIRKISPAGAVTTLAGKDPTRDQDGFSVFHNGSSDGIGAAAAFSSPWGLAADSAGNVWVADAGNRTIRMITSAGVVTTVAGQANVGGSADGTGSAARFSFPTGVAVDPDGNVLVSDSGNHTIRKISSAGVVTTLAGSAGNSGSADGTGSAARFNAPGAIVVDSRGNIFVADTGSNTIRRITAEGIVTTVAGAVGSSGSEDGTGNLARFSRPQGIAMDASGTVFVADTLNHRIRRGVAAATTVSPFAVATPQSQHLSLGANAILTGAPEGIGFAYQWKKDGVAIAGATRDTHQLTQAAVSDMGFYTVAVTTASGVVESGAAIITVAVEGASQLANFSARGMMAEYSDLTVGFVIRGSGTKSVLVRAVGPTLGSFGVPGPRADPRLDVFPAGASVATNSNDDWGGGPVLAGAFARVGAFPLPASSKDAAVLGTLAVGGYTARVTSSLAGGSGIALAEVYDSDSAGAASRLVNISTLGVVGAGTQAPALGFVIDGTAPKRLLIRAVGPGLAPLGVGGGLADPQLSVIPLGKTFTVASNDNWGGDSVLAAAFVSAGAFSLPFTSKDAAVVVRLPPGGYTVTVSGVPYTTGRVLVEIYDLDP